MQRLAQQLWYTGDIPFPEMTNFTNGELVRQLAIEQDVPSAAIGLLPTTSTWEDGQEVATAVKSSGTHRVVMVASWYYSR